MNIEWINYAISFTLVTQWIFCCAEKPKTKKAPIWRTTLKALWHIIDWIWLCCGDWTIHHHRVCQVMLVTVCINNWWKKCECFLVAPRAIMSIGHFARAVKDCFFFPRTTAKKNGVRVFERKKSQMRREREREREWNIWQYIYWMTALTCILNLFMIAIVNVLFRRSRFYRKKLWLLL